MSKRNRTTWNVVGWDADVGVLEVRASGSDEAVRSYEEAKRDAVEKLKSHIRPYLDRIAELENDRFLERGALTPMRVWQAYSVRSAVVAAKTKKRAAELVDETKSGFDTRWYECFGDRWHDLAQQEGVWIPHSNGNDPKSEDFQRCLTRDEAMEILRDFAQPYRDVDPQKLLPLVGNKQTVKGTTENGVAYEITTEAWRSGGTPPEITVHLRINDGSGVICLPQIFVEREIPNESVAWKHEGF